MNQTQATMLFLGDYAQSFSQLYVCALVILGLCTLYCIWYCPDVEDGEEEDRVDMEEILDMVVGVGSYMGRPIVSAAPSSLDHFTYQSTFSDYQ